MQKVGDTIPALSDREKMLVARLGNRSIVLVGMPGSGKSSVGRRLALVLGLPFVDADAEIEAAAGMSIPDIFAIHGEPQFRSGETRVIGRLLDSGPQVLATGGGAFMNADTRAGIANKGVSVWLRADAEILLKRIRRRSDRPLLRTDDPERTLRELMQQRDPVYALADISVESRDIPHAAVIDDIVRGVLDFLSAAPPNESALAEVRRG
jgi:shikimate kinase